MLLRQQAVVLEDEKMRAINSLNLKKETVLKSKNIFFTEEEIGNGQ